MTQRDGAAIYVGLLGAEARVADHGYHLGCECFVEVDQVDVVERQAGLSSTAGMARAGA